MEMEVQQLSHSPKQRRTPAADRPTVVSPTDCGHDATDYCDPPPGPNSPRLINALSARLMSIYENCRQSRRTGHHNNSQENGDVMWAEVHDGSNNKNNKLKRSATAQELLANNKHNSLTNGGRSAWYVGSNKLIISLFSQALHSVCLTAGLSCKCSSQSACNTTRCSYDEHEDEKEDIGALSSTELRLNAINSFTGMKRSSSIGDNVVPAPPPRISSQGRGGSWKSAGNGMVNGGKTESEGSRKRNSSDALNNCHSSPQSPVPNGKHVPQSSASHNGVGHQQHRFADPFVALN